MIEFFFGDEKISFVLIWSFGLTACILVENYLIMDEVSIPIRQEASDEVDVDKNEKSLEELPDVVLEYILSFLPTKDAVRTSVLSKRWEYLWTSIPCLNFTGDYGGNKTMLMDFVDRALVLRYSDIYEFSFECSINEEDDVRIRRWISAAVWFNVKRFKIVLDDEGDMSFELPHCFFTCASVRELYLTMIESIIVPPTICFSSLKILHLYGIEFQDDLSAQRLFSGCPVLEEMFLSEIKWDNVTNVSICTPKLRHLKIIDVDTLGEVWNESEGCQVMIFGTSLKCFQYSGELVNGYCLYELSSLEKVTITVHDVGPRSRIAAYRLYKLLMGVSKVKDLVLSHEAVEVLNSAAELPSYMPLFNNLSSLTFYEGPVNLDCKVLLKILQKSPCLEALQFRWGVVLDQNSDGKRLLDPLPSCFSSHLKKIEIRKYFGNEGQYRDMVEVLLKRAVVLDKFFLAFPESRRTEEAKMEIYNQLLALPRASAACEMIFYAVF